MTKVYLDPGHGGIDPGAVGHGLKEKDLTLSIALKVRNILNSDYTGHSIRMSRTGDQTRSLAHRTNDANSWGADLFLSIHINAFNGSSNGYEDFIYNGAVSANTANYRNVMHEEIIKQVDFSNRGKKRANFHVLRESRMPAVLTESGFIDNKSDANKLKSDAYLNRIALGHANGIAKALKLKKKTTSKKPASNNSGKLHLVQIGAFSKKTNANDLVKQAKSKGFEAYIKQESGLFKVQIGAFSSKKNADNLANRAKKSGFNVYITQ